MRFSGSSLSFHFGTFFEYYLFQANELASMTGHDDRVLSVASDSHGNLCTSSLDKSVRLWKPTLSSKTENLCHDDQVNFTSVSRNGIYLLTGSRWEFGFMYSLFYVQIFYVHLFFSWWRTEFAHRKLYILLMYYIWLCINTYRYLALH